MARSERARAMDSQSSEALSLWVLNRPEAELVPRGEAPAAEPTAEPSSALLVVLGSQGGAACARALADTALAALALGQDAHAVAVQVLADAARFRWAHAPREARFHVALRNSKGRTAGVLSAPLVPLPEQSLAAAWRYGGIIAARTRPEAASTADAGVLALPAACSESPADPEPGTVAVLVTSAGRFEAGLIQLQSDSDAGLLGYAAQPATALAAGSAGAVAVIEGCSALPEASSAEAVYAALVSGQRPAPIDEPACRRGYAWLTATEAEVASPVPSAWGLARTSAAPAPHAPAPATAGAESAAPDAGEPRRGSP